MDAADFAFTRRAWVAPTRVYDLVSDVAAIRRWSPNATDVAFDQGDGPRVGAWFSGRNHRDGKQWTTRSQITQADPGTAFTFVVGGAEDGIVRWSWTFQPQGRGTLVRQRWQLLRLDPVLAPPIPGPAPIDPLRGPCGRESTSPGAVLLDEML
ncbi:SRPBCC family protein [Streptomyces goshikiensis]|uniref:SRPBCC family protein n=1 Tax=Streptomyces goshikiensis TaxID=1942 RepID=UPI00367CA88E